MKPINTLLIISIVIPKSTISNHNSVSYSQVGKNLLNEPEIIKLQRDVDYYTRKLEQEKRYHYS